MSKKTKLEERRKRNAKYQRKLRAERARKKKCMTCGKRKVALSSRTKRLAKQCKVCLGVEANRKATMRGGLRSVAPLPVDPSAVYWLDWEAASDTFALELPCLA